MPLNQRRRLRQKNRLAQIRRRRIQQQKAEQNRRLEQFSDDYYYDYDEEQSGLTPPIIGPPIHKIPGRIQGLPKNCKRNITLTSHRNKLF